MLQIKRRRGCHCGWRQDSTENCRHASWCYRNCEHGFGYWIVDFQNILTLLFHSLLVRYWHVDGRLSRFSWQLIVSIDFSCIWCHHRNAAVGASGTIPNPTHTIYYLILHLIQILIKYKFYLEPKWFLYFFFDRMHVTRPKEPRTLN